MYDRERVARMPWYEFTASLPLLVLNTKRRFRHDVSMQVIGQPARDLSRHFVQRYVMMLSFTFISDESLVTVGTTFFASR